MRLSWGVGTIVAILVSAAVYSFGFVGVKDAISLVLLLEGLWTIICAVLVVDRKDVWYYAGWGVVLAFLSSFAFLPAGYTIGLILIAIVMLILLYVYMGGRNKIISASKVVSSPASETPAAS